jgi:hypothetical protein
VKASLYFVYNMQCLLLFVDNKIIVLFDYSYTYRTQIRNFVGLLTIAREELKGSSLLSRVKVR